MDPRPLGALPAGTAAVAVAAAGRVVMLRIGAAVRRPDAPDTYRLLLFGTTVEVVLGVLAFVAFLTHLLAVEPRRGATLFSDLFGPAPRRPRSPWPSWSSGISVTASAPRGGRPWWACGGSSASGSTGRRRALGRLYALHAAFGLVQIGLVPFVSDRPILLLAVGGHVAAVTVVSPAAFAVVRARE